MGGCAEFVCAVDDDLIVVDGASYCGVVFSLFGEEDGVVFGDLFVVVLFGEAEGLGGESL